MTIEQFVDTYTEKQRLTELDLLKTIAHYLSLAHKKKVIFITLVTKQDLWWNNRYPVQDYYQQGDYHLKIQEIESQLGRNNFVHEYISLSLVTENFRSGNSEILVPVTEGYEQKIQVLNLYQLLDFIENTFEIEIGR
jgi:hypothetical protein